MDITDHLVPNDHDEYWGRHVFLINNRKFCGFLWF
jgi:hypothetical protein